jgi:predicted phage terminase large subunit-like protein
MTTRRDKEHLAALQEEALKRHAQDSLRTFVQWMWPVLEPSTPFVPNWHIDLLCEQLEEVSAGRCPRLVINLPPRYMKSILVSVMWPCWEWMRTPSLRLVFVSYSESLATKHAVDRKNLLLSALYQRLWGDRFRLAPDQQTKLDLHNTRRGAMITTSVGGSITGKGGTRIIIDDPHNPMQAESDAQRQRAIDFFTGTLATRLDDHKKSAIVLVAQRLHYADLSAFCLSRDFASVILPVEAEYSTTIVFPRSGRRVERQAGDVLWRVREDEAQLARQKEILGSHRYEGQYQQRPSPSAGSLFERQWWRFYDELPPCTHYAQSWDLAFKDGPSNDFVVGLVAARQDASIYVMDRIKARMGFRETCAAIQSMTRRYPQAGAVYVEDAANGAAVLDFLKTSVPGLIGVQPEGGKYSRASACQPRVEAGQVYLPRPRTPSGTLIPGREWVEDFIEQMAQFPHGAHDDDVDAFSQLLVKWRYCPSGLSAGAIIRMMAEEQHDECRAGYPTLPGIRNRQF